MSTTKIYEGILDDLAQGELEKLERDIFHAMRRVYPMSRSRAELLSDIFGYLPPPEENLNNNRHDRKIRAAIASMFSKGIPIVSSSSDAGYRIDVDEEHWTELIRELEHRRDAMSQRIDAARRIRFTIIEKGREAIPTQVPATPRQLNLPEVVP